MELSGHGWRLEEWRLLRGVPYGETVLVFRGNPGRCRRVACYPGRAGASSGGPGLTLEPPSGACDATISVHATGLDVGQQIYLFAAPSAGDSAPVLLTYGPTVASTWDFTLPAGARFLCDEFAQPAMRIELSTGVTQAGEPTGVLATADFTQTAPDAAPSGRKSS